MGLTTDVKSCAGEEAPDMKIDIVFACIRV